MKIDYLGYVLALVSLAYSYYLYRKSIRIKEPVFFIKSNNLISGSTSLLENLNVSYKDRTVEDLTVSKILFYNRGAETITHQDMTINPLYISSESCKILDSSILQVNNHSNNISVRYDPPQECVYIDFDYLDKNQGVVIQVIHTGLSSEYLNINGDIRGVQKLSQVDPIKLMDKSRKIEIKWIVITILFTLMFWSLLASGWMQSIFPSDSAFTTMLGAVFGVLGVGTTIMSIIILLAAFFNLFTENYVTPDGLEKFDE